MRSTFCRPYSEEFARRCILKCFPEFEWKLLLNEQDPPDIIDEEGKVGIEVVSAVRQIDAELSNTYAQYKGRPKSEVPEKLINKFKKYKAGLGCDSDGLVISAGSVGGWTYKEIQDCITAKTEKLNKPNYDRFTVDALFIKNSGGLCFEDDLQMIARGDCFSNDKQRQFQMIFIYCYRKVYLCDAVKNSVTHRCLKDDEISGLIKDSLYAIGRGEEYQKQSEFLLH
ncbi:MAG: hypothetical protein U0M70_03240 [Eubacteriales bacterium]